MPIQPAHIRFDPHGNAASEIYDDIYFNPNDAAGKTNHLFHRATDFDKLLETLPAGQPLVVGELGFGLGLNFLGTWTKFKRLANRTSRLHYVGLDLAPPSTDQLRQALAPFTPWDVEIQQLLDEWTGRVAGVHRLRLDRCDLTLHLGDISEMLPGVHTPADAWFLDGFAPEKNPAMWSPAVAQQLFTRTRPGGTLGSYTAAGHVRRALADAGFDVERLPGTPFKRHIISAQKPLTDQSAPRVNAAAATPKFAVVGAGWAGLSVAEELCRRGREVVVIDAAAPGAGASGNRQAICAPVLDAAPSPRQDFYRSAFVLASRQHPRVGVLRRSDTQKDETALRQAAEVFGDLDGGFDWRSEPESDHDHRQQPAGLWMPRAGVARFADLAERVTALLPATARRWPFALRDLQRIKNRWQLRSADGETIHADAVVLACGAAVTRFAPAATWPLRTIRGQVSHVRATSPSETISHAVVGDAYLCPADEHGLHSVGATFAPDDPEPQLRPSDHDDNRRRARQTAPAWADAMDWTAPDGRVGFRCNTPDYLPMIGPVPDLPKSQTYFEALPGNAVPTPTDWPVHPHLYAVTALGAHGVISSALAASIIADTLDGTPPPCSAAAALAVHPGRYLTRAAKRRQPICYPD